MLRHLLYTRALQTKLPEHKTNSYTFSLALASSIISIEAPERALKSSPFMSLLRSSFGSRDHRLMAFHFKVPGHIHPLLVKHATSRRGPSAPPALSQPLEPSFRLPTGGHSGATTAISRSRAPVLVPQLAGVLGPHAQKS